MRKLVIKYQQIQIFFCFKIQENSAKMIRLHTCVINVDIYLWILLTPMFCTHTLAAIFFFFLNMEQSIKLLYIVLNKFLCKPCKELFVIHITKYTRLLYSIAIVMLDASSDEQIILQKSKAGAIVFMKMEIKKN